MNPTSNKLLTDHVSVKSRILKRIMELWGIPSTDLVDPVIKLLVDVMAYELEGVGQDLQHSNVLILEKLAEILLPGSWLLPRPFHALAKAEPLDSHVNLEPNNLFFIPSRKFDHAGEEEIFDVFFSPLGPTRLIKGDLSCIISRRNVQKQGNNGRRTRVNTGRSTSRMTDSTLWLGFEIGGGIESLPHLDLHVQLKEFAFQFGPLLDQTKWYTEAGVPLKVGFSSFIKKKTENTHFNGKEWLVRKPEQSVLTDISDHYFGQFLKIKPFQEDESIPINRLGFPTVLEKDFSASIEEAFQTALFWLRVEFPAAFSVEVLDALQMQLNVFPMVCRKSYYGQQKVKTTTKIIPLPVGDRFTFFTMDRVYDTNGTYFRRRSLKEIEAALGSYYIHKGALERFDQQSASAQIAKLLRVVREEGAVMAAFGQDLTLTNLHNLNREINAFQKRLDRTKSIGKTENNFMVAEPFKDSGTIEYEYWGIMGREATSVDAGAILQQYKDLSVAPGTARLLTQPSGGTHIETGEQKVRALRYGLLTRDRMVSREDIRQYLFYSLGDLLDKVDIKDGVSISKHPKKGLTRTVDIRLFPSSKGEVVPGILAAHLSGLEQQLNRRSIHSANYQLSIAKREITTNETN